MERLVVAAGVGRNRSAEELTRDLVGALVPGNVTDDVAVLAVEHIPLAVDRFTLCVPAEPAELAHVRHSFSRWLRGVGVGPTDVEELVLMCCEVCTNAITHAYGPMGGAIELQAEPCDGAIELMVRDFGRWSHRHERQGGRGLAMVEALAHSVAGSTTQGRYGRAHPSRRREVGLGMSELVTIRRGGDEDVVVVRVAGEIDMSNAANVADEIMEEVSNEAIGLVVDLTDVSYLDSAGIRMLLEIAKRLGWRAQILRIVAPPGSRSQQVLSIASADTLLVSTDTLEKATASFLVADDPR